MRLYDYVASANCYKARLLLAQLGKPYERVPVDIFGGDTVWVRACWLMAPPPLQLNPPPSM